MKITIELAGIELDALQRELTKEHGEYNGKTVEEFVKGCVLEQFYCHDAAYRAAITAADIGGNAPSYALFIRGSPFLACQ